MIFILDLPDYAIIFNFIKYERLDMKKFILLGFIVLFVQTEAKMLDGIALVVEGEPITTAEIRAIQKSSMKGISIDESSIDKRIEAIASQNKLSVKKMQTILQKQGTRWSKYRDSVKNSLKKGKVLQRKNCHEYSNSKRR